METMKPPRICATVTADTMAELRTRRDQITDADLIELRLDTVRDPSAAGALAGRRKPVIITCRHSAEGGYFTGSEDERRAILREALTLGAEYVDLEWRTSSDLIQQTGGRRVVLSHHDFRETPADLLARAQAMLSTGAEVVKIATTANRLSDCLALHAVGRQVRSSMVLIGMGEAGVITRLLPGRFGSIWTFAGDGVAPGQIPLRRLLDEFRFRKLGPSAAIYGVLGKPVSHSISPAMHNAAFRAANIDAVYLPLAAADFDDFLTFANGIGLAGASVTAPFKVEAFERADESDPVSRRIQAINTLRREGSRWIGFNTDVVGFLVPLKAAIRLNGLRATVMGAGGASRSVVVALASAGVDVTLSARRREQAAAVASLAGARVGEWPPPPGSWDVLVNATSAGTSPRTDESPLPPRHPIDGKLVYDLVYNPAHTKLLGEATAAGCKTIGGLDMLVGQAQAQFEWWTGRRPVDRIMRDAAQARLEQMEH